MQKTKNNTVKIAKISSKYQLSVPMDMIRIGDYHKGEVVRMEIDSETGKITLEKINTNKNLRGIAKKSGGISYQEAAKLMKNDDSKDM